MTDTSFVEVGGHRVRISVRGRGTPLLLLNGIGAPFELLDPLRAALTEFETIAIDVPGTGRSDPPRLPLRLAGYADVVARVLDATGHRQVDAFGVSWGGALAQELAWRHPDRVRRLVLAATTHGWPMVPGRLSALRILATPRRYTSPSYFAEVAPDLYGGRAREQPDLLRAQGHLRFVRPPSAWGYACQLWAISGWSSLRFLPWLRAPVLVLAGDDDPIIPLANARILAACARRSRLHVVRGGGHLFLVLRAEETARETTRFLQEASSSREAA